MLLSPLVYTTRYENAQWNDLPASIIAYGDQLYGIWFLMIPVIAAILLLTIWRESERKATYQE